LSRRAAAPAQSSDDTSAPTKPTAQQWEALFDSPMPKRLSKLVAQAIAWKQQALVEGDVPAPVLHDLKMIARQVGVSCTNSTASEAPLPSENANSQSPAVLPAVGLKRTNSRRAAAPMLPASSQLQPGARLIKAYGGQNHVVEVTAQGMLYDGQLFGSLSAVAKHITGTHWNGLLFFGLRRRGVYPKKAANG
jgi:hypothetical protein